MEQENILGQFHQEFGFQNKGVIGYPRKILGSVIKIGIND